MARIAIVYGTREGQTAKVSQHIGRVLGEAGHAVDLVDVERASDGFDWRGVDGAIIGASVHLGRHDRRVERFAERHRERLEALPSAFFSVSMAARDVTAEDRIEVDCYLADFQARTGWHPERMGEFAGALLYTRYDPFVRFVMKRIAREKGGETDTSRDHEYTDWEGVTRFAQAFSSSLEAAAA